MSQPLERLKSHIGGKPIHAILFVGPRQLFCVEGLMPEVMYVTKQMPAISEFETLGLGLFNTHVPTSFDQQIADGGLVFRLFQGISPRSQHINVVVLGSALQVAPYS